MQGPTPEDIDAYPAHLACLVSSGINVQATADIHDAGGALILARGDQLTTRKAARLTQSSPAEPLDLSIRIDGALNTIGLHQEFEALLARFPDLKSIHQRHGFQTKFANLLARKPLHPALLGKLTVQRQRMRRELEKSLFTGWMGAMVAREMDLGNEGMHNALVAGLMHDSGLLHAPPEIAFSAQQLNPANWQLLQRHVHTGAALTTAIDGLSEEVSRGILEHHEVCDGTGYPNALSGFSRCDTGRIVGMIDSIYAVRTGSLARQNRSMADILPWLELNRLTQSERLFEAIRSLISSARLSRTPLEPGQRNASFITSLRQRIGLVQELRDAVDTIGLVLGKDVSLNAENESGRTLIIANHSLRDRFERSGLLHVNWEVYNGPPDDLPSSRLGDLIDMGLMLDELSWQVRNYARKVRLVCGRADSLPAACRVVLEQQTETLFRILHALATSASPDSPAH